MNCWLVLTGMEEAAGEIAMAVKFAAALLTVRLAVDFRVPDVAVIVAVPAPEPVATPLDATLAMVASDDAHWTELVTSFDVPSDILAVAVNCCVAPVAIAMEVGATWMDDTVAAVVLLFEELLDVELLDDFPPPEQAVRVVIITIRPASSAFFIRSPIVLSTELKCLVGSD